MRTHSYDASARAAQPTDPCGACSVRRAHHGDDGRLKHWFVAPTRPERPAAAAPGGVPGLLNLPLTNGASTASVMPSRSLPHAVSPSTATVITEYLTSLDALSQSLTSADHADARARHALADSALRALVARERA